MTKEKGGEMNSPPEKSIICVLNSGPGSLGCYGYCMIVFVSASLAYYLDVLTLDQYRTSCEVGRSVHPDLHGSAAGHQVQSTLCGRTAYGPAHGKLCGIQRRSG